MSNELFDLRLLKEMDDNEYTIDILNTFLTRSPADLKDLRDACQAKNFESVYKIAHKLKGSAGLIYAHEVVKVLEKTEEFAKAQISEGLIVLAEQANECFMKLVRPLKNYITSISSATDVF